MMAQMLIDFQREVGLDLVNCWKSVNIKRHPQVNWKIYSKVSGHKKYYRLPSMTPGKNNQILQPINTHTKLTIPKNLDIRAKPKK